MKIFLWKIVFVFVFFSCRQVSYGAEENLCTLDEVLIASCHLSEKKKRIISFCASADKNLVSYRFGLGSAVELDAVFSNEVPLSRWMDIATYTVYFGFRRGGYSYVFGVPQETLGAKAFLDVERGNKNVMSVDCTDNSFGEKNLNSKAIQDVEDESVRGNGFLFPPVQVLKSP